MRSLFARSSRKSENDTTHPSQRTVPVSKFWQQQVTPPSVVEALKLDELSGFRQKLLSSGAHNGSIIQYFATQTLAIVIGLAITLGIPLLVPLFDVRFTAMFGFLIAVYPTERVFTLHKRAKQQMDREMKKALDLFSLYASAGQGIPHALRQTAESLEGGLSEQLSIALDSISGTRSLDVALRERLPYLPSEVARIFFADLAEALERGIPLKEMLKALRSTLKHEYQQMQRAEGKKLPIKMIGVAAMHFLSSIIVFILAVAVYYVISGVGST